MRAFRLIPDDTSVQPDAGPLPPAPGRGAGAGAGDRVSGRCRDGERACGGRPPADPGLRCGRLSDRRRRPRGLGPRAAGAHARLAGRRAGPGHLESLAPIVAAAPAVELLILGLGPRFLPVPAALRQALKDQGIALEAMDTGAACRTYNVLLAEDRRVAAALIAL